MEECRGSVTIAEQLGTESKMGFLFHSSPLIRQKPGKLSCRGEREEDRSRCGAERSGVEWVKQRHRSPSRHAQPARLLSLTHPATTGNLVGEILPIVLLLAGLHRVPSFFPFGEKHRNCNCGERVLALVPWQKPNDIVNRLVSPPSPLYTLPFPYPEN